MWVNIDENINLSKAHKNLVKLTVDKRSAFWTNK